MSSSVCTRSVSRSCPVRPHTMPCMEVWGGNHAADNGVVMPGVSAWVYSRPFHDEEAGGDIHYVSSCGTGRVTRLVLADVSGHGERVAGVASRLKRLMRRYVNYLDQTLFVQLLNRELSAEQSGFATSVTMTYFAPSRTLDICNAGHPRPLWYRAHRRRWELLVSDSGRDQRESREPSNLPLGVLEPTTYEEFGVRLRAGDMVLLYTDGVTESRSVAGQALGEEGLLDLVSSLDAAQPAEIIPELLTRLDGWRGDEPPEDDVTIMLLHHDGTRVRAPLADRLFAGVRLLGSAIRNLVPIGNRQPVPWPEFSRAGLLGPAQDEGSPGRVSDDERGPARSRRQFPARDGGLRHADTGTHAG